MTEQPQEWTKEAKRKADREAALARVEEKERAEYERLKAKYEGV